MQERCVVLVVRASSLTFWNRPSKKTSRLNAATNVRCCLATLGPVRNARSPINDCCSKINISNKKNCRGGCALQGRSKLGGLQLLRISHVDGEQICSTIAVCSISQIYPELTRLVKSLNLCPQQFVNCTNHMCGAGHLLLKWKPCYVLSPWTTA